MIAKILTGINEVAENAGFEEVAYFPELYLQTILEGRTPRLEVFYPEANTTKKNTERTEVASELVLAAYFESEEEPGTLEHAIFEQEKAFAMRKMLHEIMQAQTDGADFDCWPGGEVRQLIQRVQDGANKVFKITSFLTLNYEENYNV